MLSIGAIFSYSPCFADDADSPVLDLCEDIRHEYETLQITEREAQRDTDYAQLIYNYLINSQDVVLAELHQDLYYDSDINLLSILQNGLGYWSRSDDGYLAELSNKYYTSSSGINTASVKDYIFDIYRVMTNNANIGINQTISSIASSSAITQSTTSLINTNVSSLNSKLQQIQGWNTLQWEDWSNYFTLLGVSTSIDGTYSTNSNLQGKNLYYKISPDGNNNIFGGVYIELPTYYPNTGSYEYKLYTYIGNSPVEVDFEYYSSGRTLYLLFYPSNLGSSTFVIQQYHQDHLRNVLYNSAEMLVVKHCSDSLSQKEYFADLAIYDINHKLSQLEAIRGDLTAIADEVASPDLVMAKQASTNTIDAALDDFTGSGSGSAKVSDVAGASQISSTMQSGLSSGGSISNGLSVFDTSNSGFWSWFSSENASYFGVILPSEFYVNIPFIISNQNKGIASSGSLFNSNSYSVSDFIDVHLFSSLNYSQLFITITPSSYSLCTYDSNFNKISIYGGVSGDSYVSKYINLSPNEYYVRFAVNNSDLINCFIKGAYRYQLQNTRSVNTSNPDAIPDFLTDIDRETYLHLGE